MEHESFENEAVAAVLNEHFVAIKVDREERPDIDRVYMNFVQATTGSGGWPMSVWLTPELKPFYGGTYFPPSSKWGRPGFTEMLEQIAQVWRERAREGGAVGRIADGAAARHGTVGGDRYGARGRRAPPCGPAVRGRLRRAIRRLLRRAQVSPPLGAAVPSARARAHRQSAGAGDDAADAPVDGPRRHARSHRRRLPPVLGGRRLARAALREDVVRPGAARARVRRGGTGVGRSVLTWRLPRTRSCMCCAR